MGFVDLGYRCQIFRDHHRRERLMPLKGFLLHKIFTPRKILPPQEILPFGTGNTLPSRSMPPNLQPISARAIIYTNLLKKPGQFFSFCEDHPFRSQKIGDVDRWQRGSQLLSSLLDAGKVHVEDWNLGRGQRLLVPTNFPTEWCLDRYTSTKN